MQCAQPPSVKSIVEVIRNLGQACRKKTGNLLARILYRAPACHKLCEELVREKSGIEVGGPSHIFSRTGQLPLYDYVGSLDNCNFSEDSLWGKNSPHDGTYKFSIQKPAGRQKILEAVNLQGIPSATYDFLLSSHTIEHIANPIKALIEWKRLIKPLGTLILVIPHKDGTFDRHRAVTPFAHILQDYEMNTGEDDLTHLDEIMQYHDFSRDKGALNKAHFYQRALRNKENRGLHHHVFDTQLAVQLLDSAGYEITAIEPKKPFHIFVVARVSPLHRKTDNSKLLNTLSTGLLCSPFPTDNRLGRAQLEERQHT
jgi:SAM-dependent methyltransferase